MNTETKEKLLNLLSDKPFLEYWIKKTIDAVAGIEKLFNLEIKPCDLSRLWITPDNLWIVSEDELDFKYAKKIKEKFSTDTLYPIIVIEYLGEYALYMGSVRALLSTYYNGKVDCIAVSLCTAEKTTFWNSRIMTLEKYLKRNE